MAETIRLDDRVLSRIQTDFPLATRPYDALADEFNATPEAVHAAVARLREQGIVRRIGATFDPAHLGYVSTLAALAAPEDRIADIADVVNAYDEVTHNYQRDDPYNLWFTVIASTRRRIDDVLAEIATRAACGPVLDLPATRLFKIRVNFDVAGIGDASFHPHTVIPASVEAATLTEADRALVRVLQGDIGTGATPFADLADAVGIAEDEALATIGRWREAGVIRRLGAVVRHRRMGVSANAMAVWNVPDDQAVDAGELMASFTEVSHCYERVRADAWPNNLYTMIHATTPEGCRQIAARIHEVLAARGIVVPAARLLFSSREFKKRSMRYFMEDGNHATHDAGRR